MSSRGHRDLPYPFTEQNYLHLADIIYSPIKYSENVVLMCPPLYGRDHRIMQLWERKQDREKVLGNMSSQYNFSFINLVPVEKNSEAIWLSQISSSLDLSIKKMESFREFEKGVQSVLRDHDNLIFFINIPETLSDDTFVRFLGVAQRTYYICPSKIHFILAFDMKWDEDRFLEISSPFRSLFQNTKLLPLYPSRETIHFIRYYARAWNLKLSQITIDYIAECSGGIILLAKSALRIIRNEKIKTHNSFQSIISNHLDHTLQIDFFLRSLTVRQREILRKIANNEDVKDKEIYHLEQMKIVERNVSEWRIKSRFIEQYLSKAADTYLQIKQHISNDSIFTARENEILTVLLRNPGVTISRSMIAQILWGEENYDKYSDWAIDKTISRIRKKLSDNPNLTNVVLRTHKKVGFSLK